MTVLLDLDANVALERALALVEEAAQALAEVPPESVHSLGLGETLLRLRSAQRRLDATSATLTQRFADAAEWEIDGARSAAGWLSGHSNDSWGSARAQIDRGALLRDFPAVAGAWRSGEISAQHVDCLRRLQRRYPRLGEALRVVDEAIAAVAAQCEPQEFFQRLRQLCHQVDPDAMDASDRERQRATGLHVSTLLDGFVRVDATLDPVLGARFIAALESARRAVDPSTGAAEPPASTNVLTDPPSPADRAGAADPAGAADRARVADKDGLVDPPPRDPRPMSQRNLDALGRLLDAAGAATGDLSLPLVSGERPTINVTVPLEALLDEQSTEVGWLERFGLPTTVVSGAAARHLACDASLRPLIVDRSGQLVAMMPKVRAIHYALRRAVLMRDRHCRFPGCRQRIDEVHHIVFHSRGGPTVLGNLVGLCWFHHHLVHDSGWLIEGDPGGRLRFRSPHGRELTSDPPG